MARTSLTYTGWRPRAYLWDGGWIGIGRGEGIVPPHSHHAIQISLPLDGIVRLREPEAEWQEYRGAIVMPDAPHSFDPDGSVVVMLFVDPESAEGRWLRNTLSKPITAIPAARLEHCLPGLRIFWNEVLDAAATAELVRSVVHNLCVGPPPVRHLDERIVRALEAIRGSDASRIPIEEIAKKVFLSPSRFAHLFSEEVGLPFRRYVLWRKLNRAMLMIGRGNTLSAAAHAGGFADSAHLTRTFYQMFGIPPSLMLGGGEFYLIPAPFEVGSAAALAPAERPA